MNIRINLDVGVDFHTDTDAGTYVYSVGVLQDLSVCLALETEGSEMVFPRQPRPHTYHILSRSMP